jgi:hypothetical protein
MLLGPGQVHERNASMDEKTLRRVLERVDKNGPMPSHAQHLGPCWVWTGARIGFGYGQMSLSGKSARVHRLMLERKLGRRLVSGECALHHCDNPSCVNPEHLFPGTLQDNARDKCAKGRQVKGDAHYARLHPEKLARGDMHWSKRNPAAIVRGEERSRIMRSLPKRPGKTSRFIGVSWYKTAAKWQAYIGAGALQSNGRRKNMFLGLFEDESEAAKAYDHAAVEHFLSKGLPCRLNFPSV